MVNTDPQPSLHEPVFAELDTPCLLLDKARLMKNAERLAYIAHSHDVALRPHLKTSKSLEIAEILTAHTRHPAVTVSTVAEAEYFAKNGYRDILYAVGVVPGKLPRIARLQQEVGMRLLLVTDNVPVAKAAVEYSGRTGVPLRFLIEIDCGDHRSGVQPHSEDLNSIAEILDAGTWTTIEGVMTHAGHSYATNDPKKIANVAEAERAAAAHSAHCLRERGITAEIVSVGSTPTVVFAESLHGVTEVRCGVYAFYDLDQYGRGVCGFHDIALSVLATVIGHNHASNTVLIDAGGLALSKDISANGFLNDAGYGYVCAVDSLQRYDALSVNEVNQEHGKITIDDMHWYDRLPIGSQVRIVPNHACFTAAAYTEYHVLERGRWTDRWPRINGW